jgi:hypothetical protein
VDHRICLNRWLDPFTMAAPCQSQDAIEGHSLFLGCRLFQNRINGSEPQLFAWNYLRMSTPSTTALRAYSQVTITNVIVLSKYEGESVNWSKTAVIDVIGFLCVSLGSSTVQLHDGLGTRRACASSEAGFSSKNGDRVWGLYYRRAEFCCAVCMG